MTCRCREPIRGVREEGQRSQEGKTNLAHCEHPSGACKIWPKVLPDVFDGVDSETVNLVLIDQSLDPRIQTRYDIGILGIYICEGNCIIAKPALLDVCLITIVCNKAKSVKVRLVGVW